MLKSIFTPSYYYLSHGVSVTVCWEIIPPMWMNNACKESLIDGLKYHTQLSHLQEADTNVRELIRNR